MKPDDRTPVEIAAIWFSILQGAAIIAAVLILTALGGCVDGVPYEPPPAKCALPVVLALTSGLDTSNTTVTVCLQVTR